MRRTNHTAITLVQEPFLASLILGQTNYVFSDVLLWSLHLWCVLVKTSPLLNTWGSAYHFYRGRRNKLNDSEQLPYLERMTFFKTIGWISSIILSHEEELMLDYIYRKRFMGQSNWRQACDLEFGSSLINSVERNIFVQLEKHEYDLRIKRIKIIRCLVRTVGGTSVS